MDCVAERKLTLLAYRNRFKYIYLQPHHFKNSEKGSGLTAVENADSVQLANRPTPAAIRSRRMLFLPTFCLFSSTCARTASFTAVASQRCWERSAAALLRVLSSQNLPHGCLRAAPLLGVSPHLVVLLHWSSRQHIYVPAVQRRSRQTHLEAQQRGTYGHPRRRAAK